MRMNLNLPEDDLSLLDWSLTKDNATFYNGTEVWKVHISSWCFSKNRERAGGSTYRRSIEPASLLTLGQPSREPTTPGKLACRSLPSKMPYGTCHRREDHKICGSEKNHGNTWQPKDEAGVFWQKNFRTCLPMYTDKDRQQKIKYVAEKMNSDFEKKKKAGQCYPKSK